MQCFSSPPGQHVVLEDGVPEQADEIVGRDTWHVAHTADVRFNRLQQRGMPDAEMPTATMQQQQQ
jgi:hypothetical protein